MLAIYLTRAIAEKVLDRVDIDTLDRLAIACFDSQANVDLRVLIMDCALPAFEEAASGAAHVAIKKLLATYLATKYASLFIDVGFAAGLEQVGFFEITPIVDTDTAVPEFGKINADRDERAWFLDRRRFRHNIGDTNTSDCLVEQNVEVVRDVKTELLETLKQAEDAECVRANNGDIVRTDDGDAYVLESGKLRWIPTGAVYECEVSEGRRVVESVPRYWIEDLPEGAEYPDRCALPDTTTTLTTTPTTTSPTTTQPVVLPQKGKINRTRRQLLVHRPAWVPASHPEYRNVRLSHRPGPRPTKGSGPHTHQRVHANRGRHVRPRGQRRHHPTLRRRLLPSVRWRAPLDQGWHHLQLPDQ